MQRLTSTQVRAPHAGLLIAFALLLAIPAGADGFVVVRPTPGVPAPTPLAVAYHHVDITIRDQVASVAIDQVFRNPNAARLEGEYLFPIPAGAAVSDFVLYVDGEPLHAEALSADEALAIYEALVRRAIDPALLEYAGRELFRARIYPFEPHGERRVKLDYEQLVAREGGLYRFVYPLSTERFSSEDLASAYVRIDVETQRPIRNAYCPSHDVEIEYVDSRHLRVTWEATDTRPDTDLVLYYALAEEPMDIRWIPYRPVGEAEGYFMLLASLGGEQELPVMPKEIVFVVDRSGSMDGPKIEQARAALSHCLRNLNPGDRFNIVSFAGTIERFADQLRPASAHWIDLALDFVAQLEAGGGTNIAAALASALDQRFSREHAALLVFVTDGLPTEGETDPRRLLAALADDRHARIFPFGVGYDVNAPLLDQLALEHRGRPSYVRPDEDLQSRISTFYDQVADPLMTGLELEINGVRVRAREPQTLPDLFRGGQLVLFGRYRGDGPVSVALSGRLGGRRQVFSVRPETAPEDAQRDFIARLWATRRVGSLLRRIRLYGEEAELVDEVKRLGLRFGLATPYTSFLVDDQAQGPMTEALRAAPKAPLEEFKVAASGRSAFRFARAVDAMAAAEHEARSDQSAAVRRVHGRTYRLEQDRWSDIDCPTDVTPESITVGGRRYFRLLRAHPWLGAVFALGERVRFQVAGDWYETRPAR